MKVVNLHCFCGNKLGVENDFTSPNGKNRICEMCNNEVEELKEKIDKIEWDMSEQFDPHSKKSKRLQKEFDRLTDELEIYNK